MSQMEVAAELHEQYSEPGAKAPAWSDVLDVLARSEMFWLPTTEGHGPE